MKISFSTHTRWRDHLRLLTAKRPSISQVSRRTTKVLLTIMALPLTVAGNLTL